MQQRNVNERLTELEARIGGTNNIQGKTAPAGIHRSRICRILEAFLARV
jgi:hypothetical protein